ncbi:hypothetical protein SAMN04488128_108132 [Chitinophaga eiseniae]|uniref:Uncharacterized protein n=1 Tax=Chitinophaga eiseniae TaxID=634771 RepID=A0A1T4U3W6_9BACT|nr:hypothetical protein [Chitinophaga eiseniae]SKA47218.1 hypothetical protein SAMN04488128_108132 [Chitinophaga eiseniae]
MSAEKRSYTSSLPAVYRHGKSVARTGTMLLFTNDNNDTEVYGKLFAAFAGKRQSISRESDGSGPGRLPYRLWKVRNNAGGHFGVTKNGMGGRNRCEIYKRDNHGRSATAAGTKRGTEIFMLMLMRGVVRLVAAACHTGQRQLIAARYRAKRQQDNAQYDCKKSHWNKNNTFCIQIKNYYNNHVAILKGYFRSCIQSRRCSGYGADTRRLFGRSGIPGIAGQVADQQGTNCISTHRLINEKGCLSIPLVIWTINDH